MINNQDPHSQIKNDETQGADYSNENDWENDSEAQKQAKILQLLISCHKYQQKMKFQKV